MRFASKVVIILAMCAAALGQQKINPNTGINWPVATGTGAPTSSCTSTNYGQLYTDTSVTPNMFYTCGTDGWAVRTGPAGPPGPGPTLQTNSVNNASQSTLNLKNGTNVTITNTANGDVQISAAAGGSSVGAPGTIQAAGATTGSFAAATSTNLQNGIGNGVYVSATKIINGPIYFQGTSVTEGVGSYINGNSYVDILATDSGNNLQNWGVGGAQAADIALQTFRKFPQSSVYRAPLSINDLFINDANHCGATTGCLANAGEAANALLAWELIPASYRIYATAATSSGFAADTSTTFTDSTLPPIGMYTRTQNATLTFNLTNAGNEVGVTFAACDAYTSATFTVTLGGTLVDTIAAEGNNGQAILTQNGLTCTLFRKEYANSSGATVSVVIQKTDAATTAAGTVSIWAVDSNPAGAGTGAPLAWTEGVIKQNGDANAAATAAYDTLANTTATVFATDGWNSFYVPLRAGQAGANPGVNSTTDMANNPPVNPNEATGLHPNSGPGGGHYHLAQTIENFGTANGMPYFNSDVSGGHNFFYSPVQSFQHYAPANILGYNNWSVDGLASQTALNPGGIATNCFVTPTGVLTCTGIDFGFDAATGNFIGRSFSSTGHYEICSLIGLPTGQAGFNCNHDDWWSNGDYVKASGFWRPKGGISYENQTSATAQAITNNGARGTNINFINTSSGVNAWMLPLCKANTYDYQLWYFKSTGDTNPVTFNAYNTLDSINGNTSTVTGTVTAYSITSNVITVTAANSLVTGQAITLSGFGTSTFLNGANGTVTGATGTTFTMSLIHANASATEAGAFGVNAAWTGLKAPYSAALAQCSVGPTGVNTISIAQFGSGVTNAPASMKYVGTITSVAGTSDALSVTGLTTANACSEQATNSGASALTGDYVSVGSGSVTWNHSISTGGETAAVFCNVP